jgi:hypothetical protein
MNGPAGAVSFEAAALRLRMTENADLILRSLRSKRLEEWPQVRTVRPSFETALRASSG